MPLVCEVVLDKTEGVTVTVTNADDGIVQTIHADGTTLLISVDDGTDNSTFTQTASSIDIVCKTFSLTAETITCSASEDAQYLSDDTLTIQSEGDGAIGSSTNLTVDAADDLSLSATNISGDASSDFSLSATDFAAAASNSADVSASSALTLSGSATAELTGAQTTVTGEASLTCESDGSTTVSGSLTAVQGDLVSLG